MRFVLKYLISLLFLYFILYLLKSKATWVDTVYVKLFYNPYNALLTKLFGWIPFSAGDIIYFVVICYLLYRCIRIMRLKEKRGIKIIQFIIAGICIFLMTFNISWAINNYRTPLDKELGIELVYTQDELLATTQKLISITNAYQYEITRDSLQKVVIEKDLDYFNEISRNGYHKMATETDLPIQNIASAKPSLFSYALTKMGFSGYFNPFTHEAQVNDLIPTIGLPVTTAHEIAHQLGIAKESEANMLAFLVMTGQDNNTFRYAGYLYALKYCLKEVSNINEEKFLHFHQQLHPGVKENILETELFWEKHKNYSSKFFKVFYGNFLKINNQKDGMYSYNRFVDLIVNYDKKYHNLDQS